MTHLQPGERALWSQFSNPDRRHAIVVARRFVTRLPADEQTRAATAAALLHDVGKLRSGLGTWARVAATLVGPRGRRFSEYHDHETIGVEMLQAAGSAPLTIALVGRLPTAPAGLSAALAWADDI